VHCVPHTISFASQAEGSESKTIEVGRTGTRRKELSGKVMVGVVLAVQCDGRRGSGESPARMFLAHRHHFSLSLNESKR
jgi:hypothetical protein